MLFMEEQLTSMCVETLLVCSKGKKKKSLCKVTVGFMKHEAHKAVLI